MENQNFCSKFSKQYILLALLTVVLIVILLAMLNGGDKQEPVANWQTSGGIKHGVYANREWFDIEVSNINKKLARKYNIPSRTKGVVIVEIEGTRDVMMRLREGDVIREINGKRINNVRDFRKVKRNINPAAGLFLDINRAGYPMYISIPGPDYAFNSQPVQSQNRRPFSMLEVAPFLQKDINVGGIDMQTGGVGKDIENWIYKNFGGGYYACPRCGTLVPCNINTKGEVVSCPNCRSKMVLK